MRCVPPPMRRVKLGGGESYFQLSSMSITGILWCVTPNLHLALLLFPVPWFTEYVAFESDVIRLNLQDQLKMQAKYSLKSVPTKREEVSTE